MNVIDLTSMPAFRHHAARSQCCRLVVRISQRGIHAVQPQLLDRGNESTVPRRLNNRAHQLSKSLESSEIFLKWISGELREWVYRFARWSLRDSRCVFRRVLAMSPPNGKTVLQLLISCRKLGYRISSTCIIGHL